MHSTANRHTRPLKPPFHGTGGVGADRCCEMCCPLGGYIVGRSGGQELSGRLSRDRWPEAAAVCKLLNIQETCRNERCRARAEKMYRVALGALSPRVPLFSHTAGLEIKASLVSWSVQSRWTPGRIRSGTEDRLEICVGKGCGPISQPGTASLCARDTHHSRWRGAEWPLRLPSRVRGANTNGICAIHSNCRLTCVRKRAIWTGSLRRPNVSNRSLSLRTPGILNAEGRKFAVIAT